MAGAAASTTRRTGRRPTAPPPATAGAAAPPPSAAPLAPDAFAALMAALGPFEDAPALAVAVSGGPDSLALCLLAADWARARGGGATGLTVDHGLRPESAAEAAAVARWLAARGIAHATLPWRGPKPATRVQAAARAARYRLLCDWCRAHGVLHLLLAHHLDDQAETVLLRRARGSGPDGLAGMAAVREVEGLRLLRPLLPVPKDRLRAILAALGQPWLEDPGNSSPAFARSRLRRRPPATVGAANAALAEGARRRGLRRRDAEARAAAALARWARPDPAGFVELDPGVAGLDPDIARRVVERTLCAVGGRAYPPRGSRLAGLLRAVREAAGAAGTAPFRGRTLHGCRIVVIRRRNRGEQILVCREPAAIADGGVTLRPGEAALWDGRFRVRYRATGGDGPPLTVRALGDGPAAGAAARATAAGADAAKPPAPARPGLPSLWRGDRLIAVPHLGFAAAAGTPGARVEFVFYPAVPLAGPPFAGNGVASVGSCLILEARL